MSHMEERLFVKVDQRTPLQGRKAEDDFNSLLDYSRFETLL
jgi:hypothetical protein